MTLAELLTQRQALTDKLATFRTDAESGDAARMPSSSDISTVIDQRRLLDSEIEDAQRAAAGPRGHGAPTSLRMDDSGRLQTARGYDNQARAVDRSHAYHPGSDSRSFFGDAYAAQYRGDYQAQEHLLKANRMELDRALSAGQGWAQRATSTGSYGGLVVPQYIVDETALVLRSGRPAANLMRRKPLPERGMTLVVPRGTTGASAGVQATENTQLSLTDEVFTNLNVPVVTCAGMQDVSRQMIERSEPGSDSLIYADLVGAYAAAQDAQVISGSGTAGQALGLLNTAGISAAAAYGAAATAPLFINRLAGQVTALASAGTVITARAVLMHPRRWGWLSGLSDSTGRPFALPTGFMPGGANPTAQITAPGGYSGDSEEAGALSVAPVGYMANGLPVYTSSNIPTNVGTPNEDVTLVLDNTQHVLWEDGDGMPRQLSFEQTGARTWTVTLVVLNYFAFTSGRYPGATGRVGGADTVAGQGQVAPTFT